MFGKLSASVMILPGHDSVFLLQGMLAVDERKAEIMAGQNHASATFGIRPSRDSGVRDGLNSLANYIERVNWGA